VSDLYATAIHEAGHAVAALRCGCEDVEARLYDDGRDAGACFFSLPRRTSPVDVEPLRVTAVVGLSGPVAEARAEGRSHLPSAWALLRQECAPGADDNLYDQIVSRAQQGFRDFSTGLDWAESMFDGALARAQWLVNREWDLIVSVAADIAANGELSVYEEAA
jgi:hypothetical protein